MTSHELSRWGGLAFGVAGVTVFALPASAAAANQPETAFVSMDANGDGKLSPDEHVAAATRMFETMDTNTDGKVTATEMTAAHQKVTGKKAQKSDLTAAEKIKVVDIDGDGVMSLDEHTAGARSMFEKMDSNKDGYLRKAELKAGHDKHLKKSSAD